VSTLVERLTALLERGEETAVLRFSLGSACLAEDPATAARHLERALALDPGYSAAWKLLGRALLACERRADAAAAWREGIAVAERRGDVQAAKEMRVFLRRL
jgi:predicted Zn-dependent protease